MTDQRTPQPIKPVEQSQDDELREFFAQVYRAGKIVMGYLERKYQFGAQTEEERKRKKAA